jgi:hypothetical protein
MMPCLPICRQNPVVDTHSSIGHPHDSPFSPFYPTNQCLPPGGLYPNDPMPEPTYNISRASRNFPSCHHPSQLMSAVGHVFEETYCLKLPILTRLYTLCRRMPNMLQTARGKLNGLKIKIKKARTSPLARAQARFASRKVKSLVWSTSHFIAILWPLERPLSLSLS